MHYFCKSIFNGGLFLFLLCFCFLPSVWGCLNTAPGPWGLFLPSPFRELRCAMTAMLWEGDASLEQSSQHVAPRPHAASGSSVWEHRAEQHLEGDAQVKHRCHRACPAIARRRRPCEVLRASPGCIHAAERGLFLWNQSINQCGCAACSGAGAIPTPSIPNLHFVFLMRAGPVLNWLVMPSW